MFTWRDGSTYEGFWVKGRKQGAGVFRPTAHRLNGIGGGGGAALEAITSRTSSSEAVAEDGRAGPAALAAAPALAAVDVPLDSPSAAAAMQAHEGLGGSGGRAAPPGQELIFVCDYENGQLVHEEVLRAADVEAIFGSPARDAVAAQRAAEQRRRLTRKARRRRDERMGETIYKASGSWARAFFPGCPMEQTNSTKEPCTAAPARLSAPTRPPKRAGPPLVRPDAQLAAGHPIHDHRGGQAAVRSRPERRGAVSRRQALAALPAGGQRGHAAAPLHRCERVHEEGAGRVPGGGSSAE